MKDDEKIKFETDEHGDIITRPVTGWMAVPVAEIALLVAFRYVETPEELEKGQGKQIQLVMTPQQCLELAKVLKRGANTILGQDSTGKIRH